MARYRSEVRTGNAQKALLIGVLCAFLFTALSFGFAAVLPAGSDDDCGVYDASAAARGSSYAVIEAGSLRLLKGENVSARLPMASTTKAMTALVVIENTPDLNAVVTVPDIAVGVEGSSIYLRKGEHLTVKELLYGLMLRSGNDAAVTLAVNTSGSVEAFADKMNEKARSLGLTDTNFVNPHGLSAKDHYTSAYDLAVIAATALRNPVFREIVSTKFITVESRDGGETRYFANKNKILYNYEGATGVKTGYTTEAGRCLIASSVRNGMEVVAVALNHYNYFDLCSSLMDYAHENYVLEKVLDKDTVYAEVKVKKNYRVKSAELYVTNSYSYPVKKDGSEKLRSETEAVSEITAPHSKDTALGEVKIFMGNRLLFAEKLYTIYDIEKKGWLF